MLLLLFLPESALWQVATKLNALLTSENERLQQLTEDLKQKHSHMMSEVQIMVHLIFCPNVSDQTHQQQFKTRVSTISEFSVTHHSLVFPSSSSLS